MLRKGQFRLRRGQFRFAVKEQLKAVRWVEHGPAGEDQREPLNGLRWEDQNHWPLSVVCYPEGEIEKKRLGKYGLRNSD